MKGCYGGCMNGCYGGCMSEARCYFGGYETVTCQHPSPSNTISRYLNDIYISPQWV